jgi:hypothetical protein
MVIIATHATKQMAAEYLGLIPRWLATALLPCTMPSSVNPIRMVLNDGDPPSTQGNPRPYGMQPFGPVLSDANVAEVVSYSPNSCGKSAPLASPFQVSRYRAVPDRCPRGLCRINRCSVNSGRVIPLALEVGGLMLPTRKIALQTTSDCLQHRSSDLCESCA